MIAFHDFSIVPGAILEFLREARAALGYLLHHDVFVLLKRRLHVLRQ